MFPHRPFEVFALVSCVAVAAFAGVPVLRAQSAPEGPYLGGWTLNRELSTSAPAPDGRGQDGATDGGPGGGFPIGRGGPGGPGGFSGRGGGRGDFGGPQINPEELERAMSITRELMTPTARYVITAAEGGAITFTDAEGRSMRFMPNNKTEKHQLTGGTIETKTKWEGGQLRQEVSLPSRMKLLRTYAVRPDPGWLTVTTTVEGGRGGRQAPVRVVYEPDAAR